MAVFNFDTGTANFSDSGTSTANAVGSVSDDGVTFTLSVTGSGIGGLGDLLVRVQDSAGPGFSVFAVTSSTSTAPDTISLIFQLASTTPSRTAFETASNPVLQVNGGSVAGVVLGGGSAIAFTLSNPLIVSSISTLAVNFTCFCAGTRIDTPEGSKPVEALQPGDLVRLADGREVPVRWLGRQQLDTTLSTPAKANPICITRGALGAGLPIRDLRVSQDHAIAIDGLLINAGALVNGTTIYQERDVSEDFTYYHIETDAHELILAEGVAAETFIDYATRDAFENADEAPDQVIPEMPLPRIASARLVPEHVAQKLRPLLAAE